MSAIVSAPGNERRVTKDSLRDEWGTPDEVFSKLDDEFRFTLDPATNGLNGKGVLYHFAGPCTGEVGGCSCGLCMTWKDDTVFLNPPYSQVKRWVNKAQEEAFGGTTTVGLLPNNTETRWCVDTVTRCEALDEVRLVYPRIPFVAPDGVKTSSNTGGSMILVWRPPVGGKRWPRFSYWTWK